MTLKSHISRKDRECKTCHRLIPVGHRYFRDYIEEEGVGTDLIVEHTNCELYVGPEYVWPKQRLARPLKQ